MPSISGLELSRRFFVQCVEPELDHFAPGLRYSAALLGDGSEVLGYDDGLSSDHDWGPRCQIFLPPAQLPKLALELSDHLANTLPASFLGYSTHFSPPDPDDNGTQLLVEHQGGPINHRIEITSIPLFLRHHLGRELDSPLTPSDWLLIPQQKLLTLTRGLVFRDDLDLTATRYQLAYYPHDVWLYLLACGWARLGEEEHLMGRAGYTGDELGSALIGSRLVRDSMRLCFLMERQYFPYPKWFGRAFGELTVGKQLTPILEAVLAARNWRAREEKLVDAYEFLARRHNWLKLTDPLPEEVTFFFNRPFRVMGLHGFAGALLRQIKSPAVRELAQRPLLGSVDLLSDSTPFLSSPALCRLAANLWGPI